MELGRVVSYFVSKRVILTAYGPSAILIIQLEETMSSLAKSYYTPEQYLALERKAEYKNEYINGEIFAMSGASKAHNLIAGHIFVELSTQLRGKPCDIFISDMRVKVHPTGMYTYPDVVVACGEPNFEDKQLDTLTNPTVIIEVLSPSTENYDRGEKFAHYRKLESLRDYVLVAQDKVRVEHYVRSKDVGGQWIFTEISDPDGTLRLASIGCEVALQDVYNRIEFPGDEAEATNPNS